MRQDTVFQPKILKKNSVGGDTPPHTQTPSALDPLHPEILGTPLGLVVVGITASVAVGSLGWGGMRSRGVKD